MVEDVLRVGAFVPEVVTITVEVARIRSLWGRS